MVDILLMALLGIFVYSWFVLGIITVLTRTIDWSLDDPFLVPLDVILIVVFLPFFILAAPFIVGERLYDKLKEEKYD